MLDKHQRSPQEFKHGRIVEGDHVSEMCEPCGLDGGGFYHGKVLTTRSGHGNNLGQLAKASLPSKHKSVDSKVIEHHYTTPRKR